MPLYEHVFLARQDLAQAQVDALAENATKIITDNGGKIAKTETWGPDEETITHYTGQVLANLQGPGGFMRCHFTLMSPSSGMAGGGIGQCQLPSGTIIHAQFPRH
jgi:hypothetical protein